MCSLCLFKKLSQPEAIPYIFLSKHSECCCVSFVLRCGDHVFPTVYKTQTRVEVFNSAAYVSGYRWRRWPQLTHGNRTVSRRMDAMTRALTHVNSYFFMISGVGRKSAKHWLVKWPNIAHKIRLPSKKQSQKSYYRLLKMFRERKAKVCSCLVKAVTTVYKLGLKSDVVMAETKD